MANELNLALATTGIADLVARIYQPNWVQLGADVAMAEVGGATGRYTGTPPAATLPTQELEVLFYQTTPNPDALVGRGTLLWDAEGDKETPDEDILQELWKDHGLDPDDSKTITENTLNESYTEAATGITKNVDKVGAVTTIDRL